jgi:GDP-D-mannose dehydratase
LHLPFGDLSDSSNLTRIIQEVQSNEIYNLGAQSHVAVSFESPEYTADVDGMGALRLLEAIRISGLEKKTRYLRPQTIVCRCCSQGCVPSYFYSLTSTQIRRFGDSPSLG